MSPTAVSFRRCGAADPAIPLPAYESDGAAGLDVRANLPAETRQTGITLGPGTRGLVPTGLRVAIPPGFEMQVRPRSGLALRHGVTLLNTPGTIDSDYRGEIGIILINLGEREFTVRHGDRIAQLVLAPVARLVWEETPALAASERGNGGFGSTGL